MKVIGYVAATGLLLSSASLALAQAPAAGQTAANGQATELAQGQSSATQASRVPLRQHIATDLQRAGFTDVKVVPDSFLVEAKDHSGQPVTMLINPTSLTEVVAQNGSPQMAANQSGTNNSPDANSSPFVNLPQDETLSSKIIGTEVRGNADKDLGTIKDIAYSGSRIRAYILDVGGSLGNADHFVAVNPADLHVTWDGSAKKWRAEMSTTEAQLKAAPAFDYSHQG